MSIIFITIPGQQKIDFANDLHNKSGQNISLVIVQKTKYKGVGFKFKNLLKTVGLKGLLTELYYSILLRFNRNYKKYIKYFFLRTEKETKENFKPKVIEVGNVNSDQVYYILQEHKPTLLVVWGANILHPRIYGLADNAINLHMGVGEYYRGSVANHFAVLEDNRQHIGAMIHKIDDKIDTGDVYKIVRADLSLPPKELFTKLNDEAYNHFLDISHRLWSGENIVATPQKLEKSKNTLLREWTPKRRIIAARKIEDWEKTFG